MTLDRIILVIVWVIGIGLLFTIPRNKIRLAMVAFLFKQVLTWVFGLIVVEAGWIQYPIRLFSEVNRASFTFEYLLYPVVCSVFNVYYPNERHWLFKIFYYSAFCTAIIVPEIFLEKFTDLVKYIHWTWYWSWITLFITFFMSRLFCIWFFRGLHKEI